MIAHKNERKCHAALEIIPNGTIERKHEHNHEPMLPIEAEYFVALEKLKRQISADPTMDINDVKRSYQRLRDDFGNSCCMVVNAEPAAEPATTAHKIKLEPRHTINPFIREYDAATSPYQLLMSDQGHRKGFIYPTKRKR